MYIMCTKCKDGIIAEIVGKSMIRIIKRKEDFHPIGVDVTGTNFDMIVSCTLCGNLEPVECVDGQITMDTLTTKEKKDANNGKEEPKPGDGNNEDPNNGQPNPGEPNAGEQPPAGNPES